MYANDRKNGTDPFSASNASAAALGAALTGRGGMEMTASQIAMMQQQQQQRHQQLMMMQRQMAAMNQTAVSSMGMNHMMAMRGMNAASGGMQVQAGLASFPGQQATPLPAGGVGAYPMRDVEYPGPNDVMCGRGGGTNNHVGNVRFRQLVNAHKLRYLAASKTEKPMVAREVVGIWRRLNPPGRFLAQDKSAGENSLWHDVGNKKAREKASQCLRERTPDVMPFVKQLEEKAKAEKEEKMRHDGKAGNDPSKVTSTGYVEPISDQQGVKAKRRSPDAEAVPSAVPSSDEVGFGSMPPPANRVTADRVRSSSQRSVQSRGDAKKKGRKDNIEEDVDAADALLDDCFADDATMHSLMLGDCGEGGLTMEEYQNAMADFLQNAPLGEDEEGANKDVEKASREERMAAMDNSWVKSFQSIDSVSMLSGSVHASSDDKRRGSETTVPASNTNRPALQSAVSQKSAGTFGDDSLLRVVEDAPEGAFEEAAREIAEAHNKSQGTNEKSKELSQSKRTLLALQAAAGSSNMSMLSDLTDFDGSVAGAKSTASRAKKLNKDQQGTSGTSLMSELTDLSAGMGSMGLNQAGED